MNKKNEIISTMCLSFLMMVFLLAAWFFVEHDKWGHVYVFLTCSIIATILLAIHAICCRIEAKFDRLEKLLKQN